MPSWFRSKLVIPASFLVAAAVVSVVVRVVAPRSRPFYAVSIRQLLHPSQDLPNPVRVEGTLVSGSLVSRGPECRYEFSIASGDEQLRIRYDRCVVPDTLCDNRSKPRTVVALGQLDRAARRFDATAVAVKVPGPYRFLRTPDGKLVPASSCQ